MSDSSGPGEAPDATGTSGPGATGPGAVSRAAIARGALARAAGGRAAQGIGSLVQGATQDVSALVRRELDSARGEVVQSVRGAAKGAGLLSGAALAGGTAVLFGTVALWQGLGRVIGPARSALVIAVAAGGAAGALTAAGRAELSAAKPGRHQSDPRHEPPTAP